MSKYHIIDKRHLDFVDRILHLRGLQERREELLRKDFEVDYSQKALVNFREKLLAVRDKKFFIVGDYDCDGISATTIVKSLFQDLQIAHNFYLPSRFKDGYGLTVGMVDTAQQHHFDIILCLDNGVTAVAALARAKEYKIPVMIIDHHEYVVAPDVYAFLHPNLLKAEYQDCCTAGLAYLLASSLREKERDACYAGIATIADVVEVFGYNRYLIRQALSLLNQHKAPAIDALKEGQQQYDVKTLSFGIIPKMNALSRMEGVANVNHMVHYLLAPAEETKATVLQINEVNRLRKNMTQKMLQEALQMTPQGSILCYRSENYAEGLCGILAGRLAHQQRKPVLVLARKNGILKGSGRSLKGCNLFAALQGFQERFLSFGGHELAVGLSLKEEDEADFLEYLAQFHDFPIADSEDVVLLDEADLTLENVGYLEQLKPFGQGFAEVLFVLPKPEIVSSVLLKQKYPKYQLRNNVEAISFKSELAEKQGQYWIGYLERNDFGRAHVCFRIEDIL